jgi:hypothetical protein
VECRLVEEPIRQTNPSPIKVRQQVTPATALTARIRAEFLEMPGLKLTLPQARRLWNVDEASCQQALATLAAEDFLYLTRSGAYVLLPSASGLR